MNSPISLANFGVLKRFLLILLTAAAILASVVFSLYVQDVRHQKAVQQNEALHVISLEQEFLSQEFRAVETDLLFLARQTSLSEFLTQDSPALRTKIEDEYANFAAIKQTYDQIRCLDTDGQESVRINFRHGTAQIVPTSELQPKATRYYYQQALSLDKGDIFVSPFDLNVEHGQIQQPIKPVLRFLTPVFDQNKKKKGLLVLNYLGAKLLSKLSEISTGFRGETFLVNQDGEYVQANNPAYEWGWMQQHNHSFRQHFPEAWSTIQTESSGQFYQSGNQFTFQWVQPGEAFQDAQVKANSLLLVSLVRHKIAGQHSSTLLKQLLWMYAGTMLLIALLSHYWAKSAAVRALQEKQIAESEGRLRLLSSRLLETQETERRRMSRTLHDELGQIVTAIKLDLKSASRDELNDRSRQLIQNALIGSDELLKTIHQIASTVRSSVLDDLGLPDAVESYVDEFRQRTGIAVEAKLQFIRKSVPPLIGDNVYRILQESLTNIAKHAAAHRVEVVLQAEADALELTVADDGCGFELTSLDDTNRLGMLGMRERTELLGGSFQVHSAPGAGTRIHLRIALPSQQIDD